MVAVGDSVGILTIWLECTQVLIRVRFYVKGTMVSRLVRPAGDSGYFHGSLSYSPRGFQGLVIK